MSKVGKPSDQRCIPPTATKKTEQEIMLGYPLIHSIGLRNTTLSMTPAMYSLAQQIADHFNHFVAETFCPSTRRNAPEEGRPSGTNASMRLWFF